MPPSVQASSGTADASRQLLLALWERGLPRLRERLDSLDAAAVAAAAGTLTHDMQVEAASTTHKLAGSLGMFGYHGATALARELEDLLESAATPDSAQLSALAAALRASLVL